MESPDEAMKANKNAKRPRGPDNFVLGPAKLTPGSAFAGIGGVP